MTLMNENGNITKLKSLSYQNKNELIENGGK